METHDSMLDGKPTQQWGEGPPSTELEHSTTVALATQYVPGSPEEKKLLRKLDLRVIVSHPNMSLVQC
jgi:hypothetical protein